VTFGIDYAGIDENRAPDFAKARAAGVTFCIRKAVQSPYGQDHGLFVEWPAIAAAGIVRGAYLFPDLKPGAATPTVQVDAMVNALKMAGGLGPDDLAPAMDVEFPGGHLPRPIAACVEFLHELATVMRDAFGCWPLLYTSARVWDGSDTDALRQPASWLPASCPLWVKTGYVHQAGTKYSTAAPTGRPKMPFGWSIAPSPGAWIQQWDGDQRGVPGMSSTVDINRFIGLNRASSVGDTRVAWVNRKLGVSDVYWTDATDAKLAAFQRDCGLVADADIGPRTFARLSRLG
jgi:hypothetical protein